MKPPARPSMLVLVAGAGLMLAGCASTDPDRALDGVREQVRPHLAHEVRRVRSDAERAAAAEQVQALLSAPLSAAAAVQVALLHQRGLQARFEGLAATASEVAQAARLPNPGFSFGRMKRGDEIELERGLHLNLARLLTLPLAAGAEQRRLEAAQRELAMELLVLAADVRRAWVLAVAAEESLRYARQVHEAAEAGAELARRMEQVGNFNKLMRAREQGFYAEAALALARAERQRMATRERLARLLGLWGGQLAFKLPERLPELPAAALEMPAVEQQAMVQRLDVAAARLTVEQTARNLGLSRVTRFVNVLELGYTHNTSNEAPRQRGWEVTLELPLFDFGGARVARAEAVYGQALHQAAAVAVQARSEVREAYANYRLAHDIARHHLEEMLPLARRISEEQLLRYNGMLIGVFELLADARSQIGAVHAAIEAQRDFWLAEADLGQALVGRLGSPAAASAMPAMPAATQPAADPH